MIDNTLSQSSRVYLSLLIKYKKILSHRNRILYEIKHSYYSDASQLDIWTASLIEVASRIIYERLVFLKDTAPIIKNLYKEFNFVNDSPSISYSILKGINENSSLQNVVDFLEQKFLEIRKDEMYKGITLFGPHRDDIIFLLNNVVLKKFGSQGQAKIFVICLKLAQWKYLYDTVRELPILLLDDVFGKLDKKRSDRLISLIDGFGQSIITNAKSLSSNLKIQQVFIEDVIQK